MCNYEEEYEDEVLTVEDVEYKEEAWCEHCGDLEPYDATVEDGTRWCIDCATYGDTLKVTEKEREDIHTKELEHKLAYFEERIVSLKLALQARKGLHNEED